MKPVLTVILPIGDQRPTLFSTIGTVLASQSPEFELLLSDNSLDGVILKPEHLADPRVTVVKQHARLSMSDHWLKLLNIAEGEWVCFMGADDGVISTNLKFLIDEAKNTNFDVITTHRVEAFTTDKSEVIQAVVPISKCSNETTQSRWNILLASMFPQFFFDLPMPYNKAIFRKKILAGYLSSKSESFSLTPDYFLAFLISIKSRVGIHFECPVFIHGSSEFSNGWQIQNSKKTKNLDDFLARIPDQDGYLSNQPKDCILGWLGNSFLSAHYPKNTKQSISQKSLLKLLKHSFGVWINLTCVYCKNHLNNKSSTEIKMKTFFSNKACSFLRNYVLPAINSRKPVHHASQEIQGNEKMLISNLDNYFLN